MTTDKTNRKPTDAEAQAMQREVTRAMLLAYLDEFVAGRTSSERAADQLAELVERAFVGGVEFEKKQRREKLARKRR